MCDISVIVLQLANIPVLGSGTKLYIWRLKANQISLQSPPIVKLMSSTQELGFLCNVYDVHLTFAFIAYKLIN